MKIKLLLFFLFITVFSFAQGGKLKVLKGIIVSDSIKVERVTITNLTEKTFSVTDDIGQFSIFARVGDEVIFSSVVFDSEAVTLKQSDFDQLLFVISLEEKVNVLDDVKIQPFKLSGDLAYDADRIKVKPAFKIELPEIDMTTLEITGVKERVVNIAMPNIDRQIMAMDFVMMRRMLNRLALPMFMNPVYYSTTTKKVLYTTKTQAISSEAFINTIKFKFDEKFYFEKLKINENDFGLFLNFCTADEKHEKMLLKPENQLVLIEYLTKKAEEFNGFKKKE